MAKGIGLFYFFWHGIKFPLWLLTRLIGKRKKQKRNEKEEKQRKYVRNFAPTHYSWQKSFGKGKKKKSKRVKKERKVSGKANNFSGNCDY